ncbi:uncharacterized protein YukE [Nitrobacteraceae bacterium AZCC 2146]
MATSTSTGGWPDATNTGVPAGVTLLPSGDVVVNTAGAVISGLDIHGTVYINAPNVTLIDCKVTSTSFYVVKIATGVTGAVVQNCDINGVGSGNDGSSGIAGQGTFIANNIYNVENGITLQGNNSLIQDNYIHDLKASGSPHYDGIQIDGGISNATITHNTVINSFDQTSAVMIDNYFGPISNISVDNNLLVGGGYTIYSDAQFTGGSITGVSITNNHVGGGAWGATDFNLNSPIYTGNVNDGASLAQGLTTTGQPAAGSPSTPTQPAAPDAPHIASFSNDSGTVGDGITNDKTLTLTGTAVANSTVKVFDGTTQVGSATANSSGAWSLTTGTLADGSHSLTAKATSATGQTSAASTVLAVKIDTVAPNAPIETGDSIVNGNLVTLTGTAEANSAVKVFDGTTVVGTATTNSSGAWTVTTAALATGAHALTATATDAAGNVSAVSAPLDPVIGAPTTPTSPTTPTAPSSLSAPKIVSFSNDSGKVGDHITNDSTLTVTGTATANSIVEVFDGAKQVGTATANSSGAWNYTTATLADGDHSLTAKTADSAGHTSAASAALGVTIDTHAPNAPTIGAFSPNTSNPIGAVTGSDHLTLSGTAEANSSINIFDGGKQIGSATTDGSGVWKYDTGTLTDGAHSFMSKAVDVAGNTSAASASLTETVSSHAGTSAVTFTSLYQSWNDTVTFKGTADAYSQVKIYDGTNSGALGTATAAADGTWTFKTASAVSDTVHNFTAKVTDGSVTTSSSAVFGTTGNDTLNSSSGNDLLSGHGGTDTFVFAPNFGKDVINDFQASWRGHDVVQFSKSVFDNFADVLSHASQVGQDVVIADHQSDTLTLKNVKLAALDQRDFHFA